MTLEKRSADRMSNKKMMNGTGITAHVFKKEEKQIGIDFSGYEPDNINFVGDKKVCYRNDASILFFSANSYWDAFNLISKEINKRFEGDYTSKGIERLILPYYFSFRHFVELELKALIIALSKHSPETTHKISKLVEIFCKLVDEIECDSSEYYIFSKDYETAKRNSIQMCTKLSDLISQYLKFEYSDEYYRYIFEQKKGNLVLNHAVIELDYPSMNSLFYDIHDLFIKICIELRKIKYIYFTL